ncbi:putative leucine-rich repeat domain, L domain-containing protein [Medicago truncatula]|uniref:Putative leucine-rich repeat domain, L domain-containing protein n=1 Tax=Medicago truncatula TaxID=3880 RepID=A0A396IM91_MEDTR|nr:putative leucine-rich repeat domain, L domain-containing protein [Medicago truncatula]
MVSLCIDNFAYCVTLPPVGKLPCLKDLSIGGMSILETIGLEFYGREGGTSNSSFQPFPSLEKLKFENMSNWKEWLTFHDHIFPFPRLKTMKFSNCPELRGNLPCYMLAVNTRVGFSPTSDR